MATELNTSIDRLVEMARTLCRSPLGTRACADPEISNRRYQNGALKIEAIFGKEDREPNMDYTRVIFDGRIVLDQNASGSRLYSPGIWEDLVKNDYRIVTE